MVRIPNEAWKANSVGPGCDVTIMRRNLLADLNRFYNRPAYTCGTRVIRISIPIPSHSQGALRQNTVHFTANPSLSLSSILPPNVIRPDDATDSIDPNPLVNTPVDSTDDSMAVHLLINSSPNTSDPSAVVHLTDHRSVEVPDPPPTADHPPTFPLPK